MQDFYAYPQLVNLAILMNSDDKIPPYSDTKLDMYWTRSNEIELTDTFNYFDIPPQFNNVSYLSYVNEIYKNHTSHNPVMLLGNKVNYTDTIFSKFDEFLLSKRHYKFK